jgi:hypothetical protein
MNDDLGECLEIGWRLRLVASVESGKMMKGNRLLFMQFIVGTRTK